MSGEPAGVLYNVETGRHHPVVFRPAPRPSDDGPVIRYRSRGHHTEGFDTLEQAKAFMAEVGWTDIGAVWNWDGSGVPALTTELEAPDA